MHSVSFSLFYDVLGALTDNINCLVLYLFHVFLTVGGREQMGSKRGLDLGLFFSPGELRA